MRSSDIAITALAAYLKTKIPELTVLSDWPDPKHKFTFPTVSIIAAGNRGYRHEQPTIHSTSVNEVNPDLIDVIYTIGQFDYTLQVDLWAEYKSQRGLFFDKIQEAFDAGFIDQDLPCGLSLTLTDYHDLIARFDQVGYTYPDSEESSQRSEWRVKIDVFVNHSRLQVKTQSKMLDIQIIGQISEEINVASDDSTIEEINEI